MNRGPIDDPQPGKPLPLGDLLDGILEGLEVDPPASGDGPSSRPLETPRDPGPASEISPSMGEPDRRETA